MTSAGNYQIASKSSGSTDLIVNNATKSSLIILDEIGRGTATFDGLSIAWSVAEHFHGQGSESRTLFATHYHELTALSNSRKGVQNYEEFGVV